MAETYEMRALAARFTALLLEQNIPDADAVRRGVAIADALIASTPSQPKAPKEPRRTGSRWTPRTPPDPMDGAK